MDDLRTRAADTDFLTFTADETEIMRAAADVLADAIPMSRLHAAGGQDLSPPVRRQLGELGWYGLALPESGGGSGLSPVEHALFFRELGRLCGPVDVLAQFLAAFAAAREATLGPALLAGEESAVLAVRDGPGWRLLGAPAARYAVTADEAGVRLFSLDGMAADARPPLDPATSMRVVQSLPDPVVAAAEGPEGWRMAQLATAAMLVGVAEAALDLIVGYAKVRETFGRKIGAYQAVRHPCADMAMRVEAARSQLWYAAAALKEGRADAQAHLDAAKHLANEAAVANADTNIQLHGGIGVTDEHDAHLLLKRGLLLSRLFGAKRALLSRLLLATVDD